MDKIVTAFGTVVKRHRKALKLTQEEYAHRCGLDRTFVSYVENSHKVPSLISVFQFAKGLNISAAKLIAKVEEELNSMY